jgi:hypothetical protein
MLQIPTQPVPNQTLQVQLAGQNCRIDIAQKRTAMFLDLYVDESLIIGGVICENKNRIVRSAYLGFIGDLGFVDTRGTDNPYFTGLGSRFIFVYLEATDPPPAVN